MSDLAGRLVEAIGRDEEIARRALESGYRWPDVIGAVMDGSVDEGLRACDVHARYQTPSVVLRRCAADRAIVALYAKADMKCMELDDIAQQRPLTREENHLWVMADQYRYTYAAVLKLLARGYGLEAP